MYTLNCKGRLLVIDEPIVMGIINLTPDSFFSGSRTAPGEELLSRAGKMIREGAVILDLGGQSTRPGSTPVSAQEEMERVVPAIDSIRKEFPDQLISVDTYYASVAREAVSAGASIVNDISGGKLDEALIAAVAELQTPYVLMHMPGDPQTMQVNPEYRNVTIEVFDFLSHKISECTRAGIKDIIVDPGFGFGKSQEHNFQLLRQLSCFGQLGKPLMVGLSRKATIYKTLGITAGEALNGTTVLHTIALLNGASILRVHDVMEAVQAIKLVSACKKEKEQV